MLGRDVDRRKASTKRDLAKQLFPSSSPAQNGNIRDMLTKPPSTSSFAKPAVSTAAKPSAPLSSRSSNATRPLARSSSNMASLYGTDSFKDPPDIIDLTGSGSDGRAKSSFQAPFVDISDGDFSDDNALDFEAPSTLPPLPPQKTITHPPASTPDQPPATNTSRLSWSPSSPSHYQPPRIAKRVSPDEPPISQPTKRKRGLPWLQQSSNEDDIEVMYEAAAQPPAKAKKEPMVWNKTDSELKAQKKQLKTQKKESATKAEASVEEMQRAMKSYQQKAIAIALSSEQQHIKKLVVEEGKSVFFTGPAGTGKSVLMRSIIEDLKKKYGRDPEKLAVTASTGLAACNIGGMTLHSFSGIGLGKEDAQTLIKKIRRNPKAKTRWLKTRTLIIDEISMVDGDLFDKLSQIGRVIRNNGRPWGGIQLVITGDFFQLPPVPDGDKQRSVKFAFDAATWKLSIDHTIGLTEVFRQKDPEFAEMLNEMRLGRITERTVQNFKALNRELHFDDGIEVTELFPTRAEVDAANRRRLQALKSKPYHYQAFDTGDDKIRDRLLANMMAPPTLELRKGAQVMLIKNLDESLVNGSIGKVVGFTTEAAFEKTMGETGYGSETETDKKKRIRAFTNALEAGKTDTQEYPLVRFHLQDGSFRQLLCCPEDWKVELPTGETQASRRQVPLILAWALSIHKAQGQTLERVKVNLGKVFEKGQAYVALSRATTQQGLQVLDFRKDKVMAHPHVINFYNQLYSAEMAVQKKNSIASFVAKQEAPAKLGKQQPRDFGDEDEYQEAMAAGYY